MRLVGSYAASRHVITQPSPRLRPLRHFRPLSSSSRREQSGTRILQPDDFQPLHTPNPQAREIAILGAGITGLATAYDLTRTVPNAKITIYEKTKRTGGWIDSEIVEVDDGEVLFEWGPRTLRPDVGGAGAATVNLVASLGIETRIIGTPKDHPASTNRFVYYADRLTRMPGRSPGGNILTTILSGLYALFTQPIFSGVMSSILAEPSVQVRTGHVKDESVGDFVRRRFGRTLADNLASALFHGIYAGDIYKLSARTLLPSLWYMETRDPDGNGVLAEIVDLELKGNTLVPYNNIKFHNMTQKAGDQKDTKLDLSLFARMLSRCSAYTFDRGIATLTERLEEVLRGNPNVTIQTETAVKNVQFDSGQKRISLSTGAEEPPKLYDYVVSSLRPKYLRECFESQSKADPTLLKKCEVADKSVNVMVVNLYYNSPKLIEKNYRGFGYLIPRSVALDQNPERALGVIFGSETSGVTGPGAVKLIPREQFVSKVEIKSLKKSFEKAHTGSERSAKKLDSGDSTKGHERKMEAESQIEEAQSASATTVDELQAAREKADIEAITSSPMVTVRPGQDTASGTKLTVMMGGHWWDDWADSDLPNEEEAIQMARNVLERHLGVTEEPLVAKARLNRDAIPQYSPGYRDAMARIHKGLMDGFEGRLKVAGPWWQGGVGVNDCVRKARLTAFAIREQWDHNTGLEDYDKDEVWCLVDRRTGRVSVDPMNE